MNKPEARPFEPKFGGSGYADVPVDELQPIHVGPTSFEVETAAHEPIGGANALLIVL